ncbi:hypothetical protein Ddye_014327 [Dipteronia dyeriana]|uniref:Uncharacterized protein n=1 Tax=Dipteronia dyeriana TaxID=168575 RepID=A0AAD9X866_9ROSI|nr:hypothetical protein Ddye_014327 [Dipteronia dyeriana]
MGKTVKLFGFASVQSPAAVKKFVEGHTGEGTVCDVVEVGRFEGTRAHAIVEFATIEAADHIKSLAAAADRLWFKKSYLTARDMEPNSRTCHSQHKIDNVKLSVGCQLSEVIFSVLWSQENVSVKFGTDLRRFNFFLTYNSVEYKLEVSYESIWKIKLHRPRGQTAKFLVIQVINNLLLHCVKMH